jgi:hypothetical protein
MQPDICATLVPLLQGFQNGVCHFRALILTNLWMKMLHLKNFEGWVFCAVHGFNPPKGGQDTVVGRLNPVSQAVGS